MESGNLILAKKMAQSIVKDGFVRDMDLFNDISRVLKQASDDPEAKSLLNRITLIRLSTMNQNRVSTPPPPPPQNITPVAEKISPPVSPPVQEKVTPPVPPKLTPPVPEKVSPPVQPVNKPPVQAKNTPVKNKVAAPAPPKAAPPVPPKAVAPKQDVTAVAPQDEVATKGIPIGLWVLAIILVLPGGIIASLMAKKKYPAKSRALLLVGILTSVIAVLIVFISVKYTL